MERREFLGLMAGAAAAGSLPLAGESRAAPVPQAQQKAPAPAAPFALRGVYFHDGFTVEPESHAPLHWDFAQWKRQIDWLHACGLDAVEFATMLEFNRIPSTEMEKRKIADRLKLLAYVHERGMRFGYLLTNTVLSTVPPDEEPSHQLKNRAVTLCPRKPGNFEKTLANPLFYMETYREADFFEEFAADWGGCECGECGVEDYLRYVRALSERLTTLNPRASLYANTWCIGYWGKTPLAQGWKGMFDREIASSRAVIAALPGLPPNVHLGLPCHHLYRPLAFAEYGGRERTPVFPTKEDIAAARKAGRETLAWPHFVMDDDAYRPPAWGIVHSEARYIRDLLQRLQAAGIARVMGNLYLPLLQISNTYAYGQLLRDSEREPAAILRDFARLVAHRDDADALTDALIWMENHSYWQQQMPPQDRLPDLPCALDRAKASALAAGARPNAKPELPLPLAPEAWLQDLRRSLERMTWAD